MDLQRFATAGPSAGSGRVRRRRNSGRPAAAVVYPLRRTAGRSRRGGRNPQKRVPAAVRPPAAPPSAAALTVKYVVQPGDTLHRLAERFATTSGFLAALNGLHKPSLLVPGEIILVPELSPDESD